ncbi:pyridoxine 5'-phosphate synthase [Thiopseudomonas acetoxidans]|uniref:Pyridoxine 5'-phosphate synthase n=1 Tax=Thiopseudomonas acetoxidans TaxID=3041622 RepID=A0ABT7SLW1_9GAMM|nr:pyridoxine 5'-phosphate synthase [Thiopseudomonas sp. CY1220]MDM7857160.1 pyridoxine 5'-phosphate synthase [Thiopseudomonas sp. CY1220]NLC10401.1 pyridoxine 5'-phosphate synthase [Gammaproteobacteria bacterium]
MNLKQRILLGVNIDHIATVRQARGGQAPDPITAALLVEQAGADGITIHLREDRRHIQDRDVHMLREVMTTPMNFEMGVTEEMLKIVEKVRPEHVCLVPETREELTTEGGLDVLGQEARISEAVERLQKNGCEVSIFLDADNAQIQAAKRVGATTIELHTGHYAKAKDAKQLAVELEKIQKATSFALKQGLTVNAGHGLNYQNVEAIAAIPGINELNIGHAIVAHALFVGIGQAVTEMKALMLAASRR